MLEHPSDSAVAVPAAGLGAPAAPARVAADGDVAAATTSVVVVDPLPPLRDGLALMLPAEGVLVVGGASTGAEGEALIAQREPDVALIASDLPDVDGVTLLRRLVRRGLRTAVVLYADDDDRARAAAVRAGAAGVVAKRRTVSELAVALRSVATGGLWFDEPDDALVSAAGRQGDDEPAQPRRTAALSSSELRVLALVAQGGSTEETAEALSISPHTVRTHMRNVMRKLEASSRAHAVAIAIREAAISP